MGISSDAKLLYGIHLGDDDDLEGVAKQLGLESVPEGEDDFGLEDSLPRSLELVLTGHPDGCPTWFIAAKGGLMANRGYEKEVKRLPKVSKAARAALRVYEKKLKIRPCYWLASYTDF